MEEKHYRSTFSNIPTDQSKIRSTEIPLFFSVDFQKPDVETPIISENLVRCEKCKGYLNPYVEIISPGFKWKCNLCEYVNTCAEAFSMFSREPNEHTSNPIANAEFNRTHYARKDLTNDIYELEAPESFIMKTPDAPTLCFIIDVSIEALRLGVFSSALNSLREILPTINYDKRTKVALMFCSDSVYMLTTKMTLLVVPSEAPVLFSETVLFALSSSGTGKNIADIDFEAIEKFFSEKKTPHSNILAAVNLASYTLKSATIFLFFSQMPNFGVSKLEATQNISCKNSTYKSAAELLCKRNICVNLFMMSRSSTEYSTVGILSQQTGGQTFYYPNFDGFDSVSTAKLYCDLSSHFLTDVGYGAICRIRSNDGVTLKAMYGNFCQKGIDLFGYSNFNPVHSMNFEISIFSTIAKALYIQIAMIKVNTQGKRMIRIFTICIPVTNQEFYLNCDAKCIIHSLVLQSFYYESKRKGAGGDYIHKSLIRIISEILDHSLALPAHLEYLPQLAGAARKSISIRPDTNTPTDFRVYYMYLMMNYGTGLVETIIYPTLFSYYDQNLTPLSLSISSIAPEGVYLLDAGVNIYFFVGKTCDDGVIKMLFSDLKSGPIMLPSNDNEFSSYLNDLVLHLLTGRIVKPRLILVNDKEKTIYNDVFYSYMVDDRMYMLPDAVEYRNELVNNRK